MPHTKCNKDALLKSKSHPHACTPTDCTLDTDVCLMPTHCISPFLQQHSPTQGTRLTNIETIKKKPTAHSSIQQSCNTTTLCLKKTTLLYTAVVHYNFDMDQAILIILACSSYTIINLFNFSCLVAITSLICCELTILYKPMAKSTGNGKFRPPQLRNCLIIFTTSEP